MRPLILSLPLLAVACSVSTTSSETSTNNGAVIASNPAAPSPAATCTAGMPLPVTRLCQTEAAALLLPAPDAPPPPPNGCTWVINETAAGSAAVLYRAAQCDGRVTMLDITPGPRVAVMAYTILAMLNPRYGDVPHDPVVTLFDTGTADPRTRILEEARHAAADQAEAAHCQVRAYGNPEPSDALVVDVVPIPRNVDGVRTACGRYGLDEDSQTFWRVSQHTAWFFELGQETPGVDPESFTIVHRDGTRWVRS